MSESEAADEAVAGATDEGGWMLIPIPTPPLEGISWHYTGVEGLLGIISTHTLWASSPRVLNDTSELEYGAQVLQEAWTALKNGGGVPQPCVMFVETVIGDDFLPYVMDSAFLLSTSLEGDLLSQWMNYSKSDGFAIGIDRAVPLWARRTEPGFSTIIDGWVTVIYERERQLQVCTEMLAAVAQTTPGGPTNWEEHKPHWPAMVGSSRFLLGSVLLHMKHPAYVDEREVRFITGRTPKLPPKFRASNGRLIPYLEIARDPHPHESKRTQPEGTPEPGRLPITTVMCGPDVRRGTPVLVESLLSSYGYQDVEVRTSEIPFSAV